MSARAMIFAAGRGTRMRHLTADRPKPMVAVAGRPLIDHALDLLAEAGLTRAVVNTHYHPAPLEAHLAAQSRVAVILSPEAELLETGGGLKAAAPLLLPGPVVTLNADAIWAGPNPAATLLAAPPPPGGARLLLVPAERARGHRGPGDFFLDEDGRLTRRGSADSAPYVHTGAQIIDPAPVAAWPGTVFSLNPVWDAMLADGLLFGAVHAGDWCDVGQPESIPLAEALLADV